MHTAQKHLACAIFLIFIFAQQARADWGTYQGDAAHTGYISNTYDFSKFGLKWATSIGTASLNDLAVGGGKVYASASYYFGNAQSFYALDASSGSVSWSKGFGSIFSTNAPAYANGVVYLQTCDHSSDTWLHAFDGNGNYVYKSPFGAQWEHYLSPTVYGGNVYIDGGYYGGMYSFGGASGNQNWFNSTLPQYDNWTPAVDANYAYAYLGEYSPALYVINRTTGQLAFSIPDPSFNWIGWSINGAPTLGANHDVFAVNSGTLTCFDTQSRSIKWSKGGGYNGQPSLANGSIYMVRNGGITAMAEDTGNQQWVWFLTAGNLLNNPVLVTENMLFACSSTTTYGIDLLTHQTIWTYPASGRLAISDNTLYIAGSNGTISAIALVPEPATASLLFVVASLAFRAPRAMRIRSKS